MADSTLTTPMAEPTDIPSSGHEDTVLSSQSQPGPDATSLPASAAPPSDANADLLPLMGVRGLCSLFIVLGHFFSQFVQYVRMGVPVIALEFLQAVTLFFLLSGVGLSRFYSRTHALEKPQGKRNFMAKRFARLAPSYYLGLAFGMPAFIIGHQYFLPGQLPFPVVVQSAVLSPLFLQSWDMNALAWNAPLWQVSAFMFCYLLYIFVEQQVRRAEARKLVLLSSATYAIMLIIFGLVLFLDGKFLLYLHFSPWMRVGHFICGVVLGELLERQRPDPNVGLDPAVAQRWSRRADLCSALLLLTLLGCEALTLWYDGQWYSKIIYTIYMYIAEFVNVPLLACWVAALQLGAGSASKRSLSLTHRAMVTRPLLWLGHASLAVYCIHYPLITMYTWVVFGTTSPPPMALPWPHVFVIVPIIALGVVVNRYYDTPLRRYLQRKLVRKAPVHAYAALNA